MQTGPTENIKNNTQQINIVSLLHRHHLSVLWFCRSVSTALSTDSPLLTASAALFHNSGTVNQRISSNIMPKIYTH